MYGSHLSVSGGLYNALIQARDFGMDCVQVFTKNQRQWKAPPLTEQAIQTWHDTLSETGIKADAVVSHASYLINLGNADESTREKSISLFVDELKRCDLLAIPNLVIHPGAHLGKRDDPSDEAAGLARIIDALNLAHDQLPDAKAVTCLETTAGQGTTLGHQHEHLAAIINGVEASDRLGVCIDTAHLIAAGHPMQTASDVKKTLDALDSACGKGCVRVAHINDSQAVAGSRKDRHAHIGHGCIPSEAMAAVLKRRSLAKVPKVLETAKGQAEDGREWDVVNLEAMKTLAGK